MNAPQSFVRSHLYTHTHTHTCIYLRTVGQIAAGAALQPAEDGQVDVPAADHAKRRRRRKGAGAGFGRDGFLAGVDEVGVGLRFRRRVRADAHEAVLGLQGNVDALRNVIGGQGGLFETLFFLEQKGG